MATVTAFTAQRMKQIEDESIVSAELEGPDLILITRAGTRINVGSVQGPVGDAGPPGEDGDITVAQMNAAIASAINAYDPSKPGGMVARRKTTVGTSNIRSFPTPLNGLETPLFTLPANRMLKITAHVPMITADTARRLKSLILINSANGGSVVAQSVHQSSDTRWTFNLTTIETAAGVPQRYTLAAAISQNSMATRIDGQNPALILVEDIGPV